MTRRKEYEFAEILVHKLYLQLLSIPPVPKPLSKSAKTAGISFEEFRSRLRGFMRMGLSERQKQVLEYSLMGKSEREIAKVLGITQQVVNIHKGRARKKLHGLCQSRTNSV